MPAILLAILTSRIGQIAAAALAGAIWAWWATSAHCSRERTQEAALRAAANMQELSRQQTAAQEIAAEATKRLVEAQQAADENAKIIDELKRAEADVQQQQIVWKGRKVFVSDRPCGIDLDFSNRLQKLR